MSAMNGERERIGQTNGDSGLALVPSSGGALTSLVKIPRYFRWKLALDRAVAAILLVPGIPIIGLLVLLIRCTSRGPGVYRQVRVGKDGRHFTMYKLRTMYENAEAGSGAVWTQPNDPRITPLGRVMRKLHLDELPQLFNVLNGDMALIGPRPERPEFVEVLSKAIPTYRQRLVVLPGITGLAQINLEPDSGLESVRHKVALDLEYIEEANFFLDVRMSVCTLLRLIGLRGESAIRVMGLDRDIPHRGRGQSRDDESSGTAPSPRCIASQIDQEATQSDDRAVGKDHSQLPHATDPSNGRDSTAPVSGQLSRD